MMQLPASPSRPATSTVWPSLDAAGRVEGRLRSPPRWVWERRGRAGVWGQGGSVGESDFCPAGPQQACSPVP
jgi:hypothetical protein